MKNRPPKYLFLILILIFLLLFGCTNAADGQELVVPASAAAYEKPLETTLTLLACGDNILHNTVYQAAETIDSYDFQPMYALVKPYIEQADIAFINQEAPLSSDYPPSSYPAFNSPQQIGADLAAVGFDVINLANNHIMDKGAKAVLNTLDYLDTLPVAVIGAYASQEERNTPTLMTKNGITVGFLGYTYGTNGISVPKDKPYLVGLIDESIMATEITALKSQCDFLVVSMHWGSEYQLKPTKEQERLAQQLCDWGVDLIIGTHPHVIQPAQWLKSAGGQQTLVVYSLGNFLSSQDRTNTMLGGILAVEITKTADGSCGISQRGLLPTVTHFDAGFQDFLIYPLDSYTNALAKSHRLYQKGQRDLSTDHFQQLSSDIWQDFCVNAEDFKKLISSK